jgi:uncharacterized membrane protein (UPF0127 family)
MLVKVNDHKFKVTPVFTPKQIQKGMMNRKFDDSFEGMLFFMNNEDLHCFWMKNCLEFLDIVFIKDNTIARIYNNCPPCKTRECKNYCGEGNFVLELPGLTCQKLDIKEGDLITYKF